MHRRRGCSLLRAKREPEKHPLLSRRGRPRRRIKATRPNNPKGDGLHTKNPSRFAKGFFVFRRFVVACATSHTDKFMRYLLRDSCRLTAAICRFRYGPSRENLENPQIFQICEIKNNFSAEHAQSETEGILNHLLEETRKYMNHLGDYDVIVIGAGHAGIEAAHAAAVLGAKTAVFTMSLDAIGNMPCNPSIGGTAKRHAGTRIGRAWRRDGPCGRCHLFTEPDAQQGQRPRGPRSARPDRPQALPRIHETRAGTDARPCHPSG